MPNNCSRLSGPSRFPKAVALLSDAEVGGRNPPGASTGRQSNATTTTNPTARANVARAPSSGTAKASTAAAIPSSQIPPPPLSVPIRAALVSASGISARGEHRSRIATPASAAVAATRAAPKTSLIPPQSA